MLLFSYVDYLKAQVIDEAADTNGFTVRLDVIAGHFGVGSMNDRLDGMLSPDSDFIISSLDKTTYNLSMLEARAIFYNRFGISTGLLDWDFSMLDDQEVYKYLHEYLPQYVVNIPSSIPESEGDTYHSFINGSFDAFTFGIGLMGILNIKKVEFIPFCNYLYTPSENKYRVDAVELINKQNNNVIIRDYKFAEKYRPGYRVGIDIKYNYDHLIFGLRTKFSWYNTEGTGNILDKLSDGTVISSSQFNYNRKFFAYTIGFFIGFSIEKNRSR